MTVPYTERSSTNAKRVSSTVRARILEASAGWDTDPDKRQRIAERLGMRPSGVEVLFARSWSLETTLKIAELLDIDVDATTSLDTTQPESSTG